MKLRINEVLNKLTSEYYDWITLLKIEEDQKVHLYVTLGPKQLALLHAQVFAIVSIHDVFRPSGSPCGPKVSHLTQSDQIMKLKNQDTFFSVIYFNIFFFTLPTAEKYISNYYTHITS